MSIEVEIELSLTKKDYLQYYLFDYIVNIKEYLWIFIVLLLLIIPEIYFIKIGAFLFAYMILLPTLGSVIIGIIIRIINIIKDINTIIKEKLNKAKFIFNENKFIHEDRIESKEYNASAILNVEITKNYIFFYLFHRVAWILPKNQLGDKYNEILEFLSRNNISIKTYNWC